MFTRLIIATLLFCASVVSAQETVTEEASATMVKIVTSKGEITLELFPEQAPESVENFLQYASDGFYEGTIFHRVISHFMIQGGGFDAEMADAVYYLTSLAKFDDRFVIPPAHREQAIEMTEFTGDRKGSTGFGFVEKPARGL